MELTNCPICFEIPDLPVSVNISAHEKCPFIQKNLVCLRCISSMIYHHKFQHKMKCVCNSHNIDISNFWYMCYGDIYHTSDEFVEKKLWNSLYYQNKKCNSCHKTFNNIEQLYEHYKYYGNTCKPLLFNQKQIVLLVSIFLLNSFNQFIMFYYSNFCTIFIDDISMDNISKRYCIDDCADRVCNNLQKNYILYAIFFLCSYYLTINIFFENVDNFFQNKNIVWLTTSQMYDFMVLIYFIILLYFERNKLNDLFLYFFIKCIIKYSFQIKFCNKFYHYLYK